jgi:hypothetical protein
VTSSPLLLLVTLSGFLLFGVLLRGSHGATSFSSVKRIGIPWSQAKRAMDGLVATFACSLVLSSMGGASIAEARPGGEAKQSTATTTPSMVVSLTRAATPNEPVAVASRYGHYVLFGFDAPVPLRVSHAGMATKAVPCASFRADTLVLMADGSKKPIGEIKVGDKVVATDPVSGKTSVREVTRLFTHIDDDLLDLVVLTNEGVETIHTTDHHRFWNDSTKSWVETKDLKGGERLLTADGDLVTVGELKGVPGAAPMLDLTVEYDHTFYVALNDSAVLVHNQNCGIVDDVIAETNAGAKNLTSKYVLTADEALSAGMEWVGKGYTEIGQPGSGVFQSSNGLRRFRIDNGSLAGAHKPGVPHVHLETVSPTNVVTTNNHIPFTN